MKKTLTIAILFVMLVALVFTGVKAATGATLADDVYAKLSAYGMTSADKVKVERYLADNPVSDEEATAIIAKVNEAIAIMDAEGVKDYKELSADAKAQIKTLAQEAANTIGLTLVFNKGTVEVYNAEGKLIETASLSNTGKLAYTGNTNTVLVASSIAVIALAAGITVVAKKRFAKVGS